MAGKKNKATYEGDPPEVESRLVMETGLQEVEGGFVLVTKVNDDGTVDGFTFFHCDGAVNVVRGYKPLDAGIIDPPPEDVPAEDPVP